MTSLIIFIVNKERYEDQVELLQILYLLDTFVFHFLVFRLQLTSKIYVHISYSLRFSACCYFFRNMLFHNFVVFLQNCMHFFKNLEENCDDIVIEKNSLMELKKLMRRHKFLDELENSLY